MCQLYFLFGNVGKSTFQGFSARNTFRPEQFFVSRFSSFSPKSHECMDKKKQHIAIFTTASLPWLTGTAVNPLFRAAYLAKDEETKVTLVIPWLKKADQKHVFPNSITFASSAEQEEYVRKWLEESTGLRSSFTIRFYPGRYSLGKRSILGLGDITKVIPDDEADVAVLEEPEHLTWYHHGKRWKIKFRLVIGIVHTNYVEYVRRDKNGQLQAFFLKHFNSWIVDIYCHRVIRLSAATQELPRSVVCNVHGVNPRFLDIGMKMRDQQHNGAHAFTKGAYYIGKMVWNKGYKELFKLLGDNQKELTGLEVDLYGSGEDSEQVEEAAKDLKISVRVKRGLDHADPLFHDYKVFLNPSTTDVVCTTTAEALAMGKIVICANHPSNDFFRQFPNCRTYKDSKGFVEETRKALQDQPAPLTDAQMHELSWEVATERFMKHAQLNNNNIAAKKLTKTCSKILLPTSMSLKRNLEAASALIHFVGTTFVTREADEEQCKEVGLLPPSERRLFSSRRCAF